MTIIKRWMKLVLAASAVSTLLACGSDDDDSLATQSTKVTVQYAAKVGAQDFNCGTTYSGIGIGNADSYNISDLRFYVSDVSVMLASGAEAAVALTQDGIWQYDNVALLDFEDGCGAGTTNIRTVVEGNYTATANDTATGLCFTLGIPFDYNHLDTANSPSPLNVSGMFWNWQGGHKFLRIDGVGDPDNLAVGYNIHLGSTGCISEAKTTVPSIDCSNANRSRICLNEFNIDGGTVGVMIDALLADTDITASTPDTPPGCQSANFDPECIEIMPKFGVDFIFMDGVNPPLTIAQEGQVLFKAL